MRCIAGCIKCEALKLFKRQQPTQPMPATKLGRVAVKILFEWGKSVCLSCPDTRSSTLDVRKPQVFRMPCRKGSSCCAIEARGRRYFCRDGLTVPLASLQARQHGGEVLAAAVFLLNELPVKLQRARPHWRVGVNGCCRLLRKGQIL